MSVCWIEVVKYFLRTFGTPSVCYSRCSNFGEHLRITKIEIQLSLHMYFEQGVHCRECLLKGVPLQVGRLNGIKSQ